MSSRDPSPDLVAFVNDLKAVLGRHAHLSAMEMLAGTSQLVGNLVALQDQRRVTPAMAMELVARNLEIGNATAVEGLLTPSGQA